MEKAKVAGANYLVQQTRQSSPTMKVSEYSNEVGRPEADGYIAAIGRNDHTPARHAARAIEAGDDQGC